MRSAAPEVTSVGTLDEPLRRFAPFDALPPTRRPREYRLVRDADGCRVRVWFTLGHDSGWFDGHFPHRPVLPGVTQLHLAALVGNAAFGPLTVLGSRRVKFQRPVPPDASLELELTADAPLVTRVQFTWRTDGEPAASGTLVVRTGAPAPA